MLYTILRGICKIIALIIFRVKVTNADNFNKTNGRCIICCNHISMIDPVLIACFVKRKINFMGKKELFDVPILKNILKGVGVFPVDRTGVSLSAIKYAISLLKEDKVLGIFPEGTRVKEFNEENAKSGVSMIANMSNSLIVPVFIRSKFKLFSKVEIIFGEPTNYFEGIEGKITSEHHTEIGKQILRDIYSLDKVV